MSDAIHRPPLLVAVVTYQSRDVLPGLIYSLRDALRGIPKSRLVFADNASADGSADLAAELAPDATVLRNGVNRGYAAGINACASVATQDEALLILNADVRLSSYCVTALIDASAEPSVGVVVPRVRDAQGRHESTLRRRPTALRIWGEALLGRYASSFRVLGERIPPEQIVHNGHIDVDWANGAVMLIPARVRARIGRWDEDYFLYSEEVDYCRRVRDAGLRVRQVTDAWATHLGGRVRHAPALWAQMVANRVVHLARWEGRVSAASAWSALVLAQILRLPLCRGVHRRALLTLLTGRRQLLAGVPVYPAIPDDRYMQEPF